MALSTPEEWLPVLAKRLDARQATIAKLRSYVNGNAPLPSMGPNTRATWEAFQKKARVNYGGASVDSHANRIQVRGVRVGSDDQSPASLAARRIARDNRLSMVISQAVRTMLAARTGYLVAGVGPDGQAIITAEEPEQFYAEPDPFRAWRTRAAIKVWRDTIEDTDHALVWVSGQRQEFTRGSFITTTTDSRAVHLTAAGEWAPGAVEEYAGNPPVWIFDRDNGQSLVEPHTDLIDQINQSKLQRLSIVAVQAFKQRALKKQPGARLPEQDAEGNPIDWASVLEPAPGSLWDLPEGIDIWESQNIDITPILTGEKDDKRTYAAVTGTPMSMIQPDNTNQSAAGANATTAQQVDACRNDIERIRLAAAAAVVRALEIEGVELGEETVEVEFENPAWVTLAEKMDAYTKAVASGVSVAMAQKEILGWSQEMIDEDARNRRRERNLTAAVAKLGQQQPPEQPQAQDAVAGAA